MSDDSPTTPGRRTIDEVHESLRRRIRRDMPWAQIYTQKGKTQKAERNYISVLKQVIQEEGGTIGSVAGTQKPTDIRGVRYLGVEGVFNYEAKKINNHSGSFCLNDTLPQGSNVYYIFMRCVSHSVDIRKATELTNDEYLTPDHYSTALDNLGVCVDRMRSRGDSTDVCDFQELFRVTIKLMEVAVKTKMISFIDFGEMFKFTTTFGFFKSRPRPNFFLSTNIFTTHIREEDEDVPLHILKERLTGQSSE